MSGRSRLLKLGGIGSMVISTDCIPLNASVGSAGREFQWIHGARHDPVEMDGRMDGSGMDQGWIGDGSGMDEK